MTVLNIIAAANAGGAGYSHTCTDFKNCEKVDTFTGQNWPGYNQVVCLSKPARQQLWRPAPAVCACCASSCRE